MVSSTGMRVGDKKGYPVEKLPKLVRPKHRKGVSARNVGVAGAGAGAGAAAGTRGCPVTGFGAGVRRQAHRWSTGGA